MAEVSARPSNTLMTPAFSATKTRPSGENSTAVGSVRPLKTTSSRKPEGAASATGTGSGPSAALPSAAATAPRTHRRSPRIPLAREAYGEGTNRAMGAP